MDLTTEIVNLKKAVRDAVRNGDQDAANRALEELNAASEEAGAAGVEEAQVFTLANFGA